MAGGGGVEWAQVRALLTLDTRTPMGRERAETLDPSNHVEHVRSDLRDTRLARLALGEAGVPPWEVIPDVRPVLDRARTPGGVAEGPELATLLPVLDAVGRLAAYGRSIQPVAPELGAAFTRLPAPGALRNLLRRCLDADGMVRDEASPALRRMRQRLRDLRRDLVRRLEGYLHGPGAELLFHDRYVTVRHGRYVLPVLASAKGRLRGIVHDRSQSGATLFVEPEDVVEANNDLVQGEREEEAEVLRVLAMLTDAVREALPELDVLVAGLGQLDLVFARAELGERMQAVEPEVGDARTVDVTGARHPLLLAQSWRDPARPVVPVDIRLDAERPLLVITGPNAGGKTVALKTLGLLVLMAQAGLHVPASEGARLPIVSQVFAIVGDDQSVAENLSTFSAFVKHLRQVLEEVDERSLVLLDELGAGTDPDDGAALAQSVLEALADRGALCLASTHLEPLKAFAGTHPRARNASVEFDAQRLAPTFRLVYDRPGQSYALAIGARLGLPPALLERAREHRTAQGHRLQELVARLDERDRRDAERAARLEEREAETAALLASARAEADSARQEATGRLAEARAEAQRLIGEVRRAVNEEWEHLRRGERTRATLERSRKRMAETAARLTAESERAGGQQAGGRAADPTPGDKVEVVHLGLRGEVLGVEGGAATVRAGAVTVKVPLQALRVTAPGSAGPGPAPAPRRAEGPRMPGKERVGSELHIIGRTTDEARNALEKYLDDAFLAGLATVRIVHGKGTGALRRAVHELLAGHPLVAEHRPGTSHEGGEGATVATLRTA